MIVESKKAQDRQANNCHLAWKYYLQAEQQQNDSGLPRSGEMISFQDCQCPEDVITAIQSLVKELCSFCDENKNYPMNTNLLLFDPLLALNNFTPSIHFALVEDIPYSDKLEFSSKWHREEQLKELSSFLENAANQGNQNPEESRHSCSSDGDSDISDRLHQLADGLPDQAGVRTDIFWFICGKSNLALRSHLHLFGALKRLQQWHDAHITVVCSNEFDRNSFTKEWQKGLKFSVTDLKKNYASTNVFNPSVVWQGSLVFSEGQSRTELLSFSLCGERNQNKIEPKLCSKRPKNKNCSARNGNSLCIAPEISILCKVQKNTVPFHMFLPVRLGLVLCQIFSSVDCSSPKLSARFVEWFSLEKHKDIALIASLSLVTPCKRVSKRENKEAWFNFVQSQDHSTTTKPVSKDGHEEQVSSRRVCLICGDTDKELSLYVLRSPEQLNGWIQQELSSIHSSFLISNDQQVGGPLRFPDLSDSFLATEQNLTEALLRTLQHELEKSDDIFSDDSPSDIMEQLISAKLKILKQKREKLMTDGKKYQLNAVKRDVLRQDTSGLPLTPSKWPEKAWLVKNDPNATVKGALAEDTTKPFPLLSSVSSLSIQDILEKFRMDGTPVRSDLVPVQPREESLNGRHIQIGISRSADDVKEKLYPESLAESYHGIEYCLDAREAVSKDSQVTHLQSSHVKLETLSSCVQSHKTQTSRSTRNFTKLAKNDKKQSLAKLSVPLNKLEAVVKGKKPTCLTGRSLKKKSPLVTKPAIAAKRKREEPEVKEGKAIQENDDKMKETRSERHKRRLRQVIQKTLEDNGIDSNHSFYKSCTERLYSLCKSFLKDLTSSHGLNDEMKRLAKSNVQQVIDFETKRKSAAQQT